MTKFFRYILLTIAIVCMLPSCKEDDKEKTTLSDSVRISAFSLKSDSTVLDNLNTVFFTIDLEKGLIYNADSLPRETDISALKINITTENASAINLTTIDSTYNYLDNENKAINFNFPITAEVVSRSGNFKKQYQIKVNVHRLNPDQLYWGGMQYSRLPGEGTLTEQRTVKCNDLIYCFMTRDNNHYMATTANPGEDWDITTLSLPFEPNWQSMRTDGTILCILDTDNKLYTSANGVDWENTETNCTAIMGILNGEALILTNDGTHYYHDKYPRPEGFTPRQVAQDFPISGFSDMLTYNSPWLSSPQGMIVGGRTSSGELTGAMWGYDGNAWAKLNNTITPREGAAFFSYVTFFVDDNWVTTEMPTWFVIGGIDNKGALRDVWTSNNYGINWTSGGENLFVPGYIVSRGYASVVICDEPINSTFSTWHSIDMMPLPQGYRCLPMRSVADENKVPYIYMFGGKAVGVNHYDQVWRATINRLRFEPIP
ncbi:MAG: hypothetical protein E7084_03300 [Bacteroidales bacterium]|nr:hypothetical protein [Bacteroidales bacterium]